MGCFVHATAAELSSIKANLTERLQVSGDKLFSVSAERDQLKDNFTALTQEKDRLQLLLKQSKTYPEGWKMLSGSSYLFSTRADSWTNARTDCRDQGADLVIIDSPQEQKLISDIVKSHTWIGLSDTEIEGTWKWVNGTPLTATEAYWGAKPGSVQPDDAGGNEDCVEMVVSWNSKRNWNDRDCAFPLKWICEKLV
ncbi:C-type lectin domain family 4 member E-like [Pungitius pungitius]|uniref:C-type lectin domain family 4 member E-like n=1 Tax=Pungitius pungitius TaxID=134920 RepID=UPI002E136ABC